MDNTLHRGLMSLSDWKEINHFTKDEFKCHCGCGVKMNRDFVFRVDSLRARLGFPLVVTSGYRCEEWNKKVGGSPNSKHIQGLAADLKIVSSNHRYEVLKEVFSMHFAGIGIADNFVHIDDRDSNLVSWTY